MIYLFWTIILLLSFLATAFVLVPLLHYHHKKISWLVILLVPPLSIGLYLYWGNALPLLYSWKQQEQAALIKKDLAKNPDLIIKQLNNYVEIHPQVAKAWYLLGRLYLGKADYSLALAAFDQARHHDSNPDYMIAFSEAEMLKNRRLSPPTILMLQRLLMDNLNKIECLNLLALNAFIQKNYPGAIHYWQQLLPLLRADDPDRLLISKMITQAESPPVGQNTGHF